MTGLIAAVPIGAGGPARTAATIGLIGIGARILVGDVAAAVIGRVRRIAVGDLGLGSAAAKYGQRRAPDNCPACDTAKK
jgi:hypothetical protein